MIFKTIYIILLVLMILYGLYFVVTGIYGLVISKRTLKKYKAKSKFAIVVAARNEETVIGSLIKSLKKMDYPDNLHEIYIIPNNCTDNTKKICLDLGANVLDIDIPTKTKGEVLKWTFDKLKEDKTIDGYIIFDADNVVDKNFLNVMNDVLLNGYEVAQGFRDSKNGYDNRISGSYDIYYLVQNIFFNRARRNMNSSSSINGTGFMISKKIIDSEGFNTYSLTEDMEYTGQCAIKNRPIFFAEEAITYDEQPLMFKHSFNQRRRWSAGIIECFKLYSIKLLKSFFKNGNISSLDLFLLYLAPYVQVLSFILTMILFILDICGYEFNSYITWIYSLGIMMFVISYIVTIIFNLCVLCYKKKKVSKMITSIIYFPIFIISWIPINILCLINKKTKWTEVKHNRNIEIEDIK